MSRRTIARAAALGLVVATAAGLFLLSGRSRTSPAPLATTPPKPAALTVTKVKGDALPLLKPTDPSRVEALQKMFYPISRSRTIEVAAPVPGSGLPKGPFRIDRPVTLFENGGTYGFDNASYGATLHFGAVEFGSQERIESIGRPLLQYSLSEIRMGDAVLARGGSVKPEARPGERMVAYGRGAVEEQYFLRDDGLEQVFLIRDLPAKRGAIVVSGEISTNLQPPSEGARGRKLAFSHEGKDRISVSEAVAIDAAGRTLPLDLTYAGGRISMTLPAEWVSSATLPLRIDPLIGGAFIIDSSADISLHGGGDTRGGHQTAVAYGSNLHEWIVLWAERFGTTGYQGRAQFIDSDGVLVGTQQGFSATLPVLYDIAVSYSSPATDLFLVCWAETFPPSFTYIHSIVFRASDRFASYEDIPIEEPADVSNPSLAFDGTNFFLCAEKKVFNPIERRLIVGTFLDNRGHFIRRFDPQTTPAQGYPRIAFSGGYYMLTYHSEANGLIARRMTPAGTFPEGTAFTVIAPGINPRSEHAISPGPDGKFFLFYYTGGGLPLGRFINSNMTFDGPAFATVTAGAGDQLATDYSPANQKWLVVTPGTSTADRDLRYASVALPNTVSATSNIPAPTPATIFPSVSYNAYNNTFLLVYADGAAGTYAILGQYLTLGPPPAPVAPLNFHGTVLDQTRILWQWDDLTNESFYLLHDGFSDGVVGVPNQDQNFYEENLFFDNSFARRHVHGQNGGGIGPASNSAEHFTFIHKPAPREFSLIKNTGNSVKFDVVPPRNAFTVIPGGQNLTAVQIEASTNPSDPLSWIAAVPYGTNYTPIASGLAYSTHYFFRVRFRNGDGVPGEASNVVGPWITAPAAPAWFTGFASAYNAATWSWADTTEEFGYELFTEPGESRGVTFADVTTFDEGGLSENSFYRRYVVPFNAAGYGQPSNTWDVYTPVRPPTSGDFTAIGVGSTEIAIVLRQPVNPTFIQTGCLIETASGPNGPWALLQDWSQNYSVNHRNLTPGTTYFYRIRYRSSQGELTPYSDARSATTTTATPTGFAGVAVSPTSIQWSWNDVSGETNYRLEDEKDLPKQLIGPDTVLYVEPGLLPNRAYTRHIRALNAGGPSQPSNNDRRYTLLPDPTIADFSVTLVANTAVDVVIKPPANPKADATGAQIEILGGAYAAWTPLIPYNSNYISGIGLDPGVSYQFRIRFQNGDGIPTGPSPARTVFTGTPDAPTNFAGVAQSPTSIQWSWTNSANATDYQLHDPAEGDQGKAPGTPFLEDNLQENRPYTRHVHALNGWMSSGPSGSVTRYTSVHNPKVSDFVAAPISTTQIQVTVTPPPDPNAPNSTGVKIQWRPTSSPPGTGAWQLLKDFDTSFTFTHNGRSPNTSYDYRIQFRNGDGITTTNSGYQSVVTSAPPAPTNFAGVAQGASTIKWTWTGVDGETEYRLHDPAGEILKGSPPANTTSYLETPLPENTRQTRHLHAFNAVGQSAASNDAFAITEVHDPTENDFTVLFSSSTSIETAVTPPLFPTTDQTGVKVQSSANNTGWSLVTDFTQQYTVPDVTGVNANYSYRYRIQYRNQEGKTTPWSASKVVSLVPVLLSPLTGSATNNLRPVLTWTPAAAKPPFTYELQVDNNGNFATPAISIATLTAPTFTPSADLAQGLYRWRVRAVFSPTDAGPWSEVSLFRVDTNKPAKPALISPIGGAYVGSTMPTFTWSASADPSGATYQIQISTGTSFASPIVDIPSIDIATYTLPTPLAEGLYYWQVRATDGAGNVGNYSTADSFNLDLTAPPPVTLLLPNEQPAETTGLSAFSWTAVSDPSGVSYRLQVSRDHEFVSALAIDARNITGTSYPTPAPLKLASGSYLWRVQAVDGAGNVSTSAVRRLTVQTTPSAPTPSIDVSSTRKTNDRTPTITGRSLEVTDVTINVYVNSITSFENPAPIPVQPDGTWTYTLTQKPEGFYVVYAKASKTGVQDSAFSNPAWITVDRSVNHALDVSVTAAQLSPGGPPGQGNHIHVSWVASPDPDVIGYFVYRAVDNSPPGAPNPNPPGLIYTKLNPQPVVGTKWCDDTAQPNTTYRYKIVAVDNTKQEE